MKGIKTVFHVMICFIICSCSSDGRTDFSDSEISNRIFQYQNQGWKSKSVTHFVNDIQYKATEVPIEYYLLKNQGADNLQSIDTLSEVNSRERIIEFEFEHINNDDLLKSDYTALEYDKSVIYMASTIQSDFTVITSSNDTIRCSGVHFERNFKVAPYKRVLLYFSDIAPNETLQLIYEDQLFGQGIFKFKLNEIPFKS